jgi:hypothetical protein
LTAADKGGNELRTVVLKDIRAGGESENIDGAAFMDAAAKSMPEQSQMDGGPVSGAFKSEEVREEWHSAMFLLFF